MRISSCGAKVRITEVTVIFMLIQDFAETFVTKVERAKSADLK